MPWCPKCAAEYEGGVLQCAECEAPLQDEPSAPPQPVKLVLLARMPLGRALVARAVLEESGIFTHIDAEEVHHMMPLDFQGAVSSRLLVAADQIEEARLALSIPTEKEKPLAYSATEEAVRLGWKAILGGVIPFYALFALVENIRWLKYNGDTGSPGERRLVRCSLWMSAAYLLLWSGVTAWLLFGGRFTAAFQYLQVDILRP
jgi:hypothetical protein